MPSITEKHVAVVLSKPLQDDQVTVEYASRLQRLVHAMQLEEYRPDVIVLVGDRHGNALLADCDAGYMYLRHLCAMQQVDLTTASATTGTNKIQFRLERSSVQEGALENVPQYERRHQHTLHYHRVSIGMERPTENPDLGTLCISNLCGNP